MDENKEMMALAEILPLPLKLIIKSEEVDVSPLKLGEIVRIGKALNALKAYFTQDKNVSQVAIELLTSPDADVILKALAVLVRKPDEWINDLCMDEAVEILAAVLGNNMDVFQKKIMPTILAFSSRIQAQVQIQS